MEHLPLELVVYKKDSNFPWVRIYDRFSFEYKLKSSFCFGLMKPTVRIPDTDKIEEILESNSEFGLGFRYKKKIFGTTSIQCINRVFKKACKYCKLEEKLEYNPKYAEEYIYKDLKHTEECLKEDLKHTEECLQEDVKNLEEIQIEEPIIQDCVKKDDVLEKTEPQETPPKQGLHERSICHLVGGLSNLNSNASSVNSILDCYPVLDFQYVRDLIDEMNEGLPFPPEIDFGSISTIEQLYSDAFKERLEDSKKVISKSIPTLNSEQSCY